MSSLPHLPSFNEKPTDAINQLYELGVEDIEISSFCRRRSVHYRLLVIAFGLVSQVIMFSGVLEWFGTLAIEIAFIIIILIVIGFMVDYWVSSIIYSRAADLLLRRKLILAEVSKLANNSTSFAFFLRNFKSEALAARRTGMQRHPGGGFYNEMSEYTIKRFAMECYDIIPLVELTSLSESRWQRGANFSVPAFNGNQWLKLAEEYLATCNIIIFHYNGDGLSLHREFELLRNYVKKKPILFLVPRSLWETGKLAEAIRCCDYATIAYYDDFHPRICPLSIFKEIELPPSLKARAREPHNDQFLPIDISRTWIKAWILKSSSA